MVRLAPVEAARVNEALRRSKGVRAPFVGSRPPFASQRTPLFLGHHLQPYDATARSERGAEGQGRCPNWCAPTRSR